MCAKQQKEDRAWFAIVDALRCRLLRFDRTESAIARVEELATFENAWPKHERSRQMTPGRITGHTDAVPSNYVAEQLRRFMHETVTWLKAECAARQIDRLVILATPTALEQLRRSYESRNGRFDLRQGDLTQFSTSALAVHPLVRGLLDEGGTSGGSPECHESEEEH